MAPAAPKGQASAGAARMAVQLHLWAWRRCTDAGQAVMAAGCLQKGQGGAERVCKP